MLDEVNRISKANASLLVYLKHMELEAGDEIERANFHLEREFQGTLVHDDKDIEQDKVLIFSSH